METPQKLFAGTIADNITVKNPTIIPNTIPIKLTFKIGIEPNNSVFTYLRNIEDIMVTIHPNNNPSGIAFTLRIKLSKTTNF